MHFLESLGEGRITKVQSESQCFGQLSRRSFSVPGFFSFFHNLDSRELSRGRISTFSQFYADGSEKIVVVFFFL